ncbi:MAG TPA: LamG domain-containing protein [Candidatus Paceibacterota bacterium]|nr:LamG domain-containing protein [Candidatus Paceibacterota bacterium]
MSKFYRGIGIMAALVLLGIIAFGSYYIKIDWGKNQALARASSSVSSPSYSFNFSGKSTIEEASKPGDSDSKDWWVESGGLLKLNNGVGETLEGNLPDDDSMRKKYAKSDPTESDNGYHPQNIFRMFTQNEWQDSEQTMYMKVMGSNLFNPKNSNSFNGLSLVARYQDDSDYYYLGVQMDGKAVIKKKKGGQFETLDSESLFSGKYDPAQNPNLIPDNKLIGLRSRVINNSDGSVSLQLYVDTSGKGSWKLAAQAVDKGRDLGAPLTKAGNGGVITDYMNVEFSDYEVSVLNAKDGGSDTAKDASSSNDSSDKSTDSSDSSSTDSGKNDSSSKDNSSDSSSSSYDSAVLSDKPVMFLTMGNPGSGSETDKSGNGNDGKYKGGTPSTAKLPNGDSAAVFNGSSQYLSVPSDASLSISTTHKLTWEAWIKPDSFNFSNASEDGYVDWMGKCADYSPTCEWEARLYGNDTAEGRPDRLSAYVFNSGAGLGSGADWQPSSKLQTGQWIHVVAEYDEDSTPSPCSSSYPGTISIWVDGVKQDFGSHAPTGCMSQYKVKPKANDSPLNIGTMAFDTWFKGAIGKVAVYDHLLSASEIADHYKSMTGSSPSGSCKDTCTAKGIM